jgi:hypothetical protein
VTAAESGIDPLAVEMARRTLPTCAVKRLELLVQARFHLACTRPSTCREFRRLFAVAQGLLAEGRPSNSRPKSLRLLMLPPRWRSDLQISPHFRGSEERQYGLAQTEFASCSSTSPWQGSGAHQQTRSRPRNSGKRAISSG